MRRFLVVDTIPVLSQSQCSDIRAAVYELRSLWISRNRQFPFYTLAVASYLDATEDAFGYYCGQAALHNPVLKASFQLLYERVAAALEQHLRAPVNYCEAYALPGFHIFLAHEIFRDSVASIHCDLQYQLLDWGDPATVDFTRPLSFTLSISLPRAGAGLNVWELEHHEVDGLPSWRVNILTQTRRKLHVPYEAGSMVLHSGHNVHQIAPMAHAEPGEERITLQGHAVLKDGVWQLYW